ncbi:MAG: cell division ATP-binding protein FtsE [Deltaproteobacteria bacterium RBG_16_48_10]|nr:MAG: cell division ATP-binding protein FtsE [Deltaproteobacteria bacterium RBG_16_48_10]
MIQMTHVSKTYPSQIAALADINLEIFPGQFTFIVGPSGSGKTTLLHILFCSERPTRGQVIVNGIDTTQKSFKKIYQLRRTIGMVFQDFKLLRDRTVAENIAFALQVIGNPQKEIQRRVLEILEWVGLLGRERDSVLTLSAGEKQRVAIARAIVNNPPLILADEPTGNLDDQMAGDVMKLFMALHQQGTTVVFATQNKDLIQRYSYPVIQLLKGKRVDDEIGIEVKAET